MKIVFASNNKNKIVEIQKQLPSHIQLVTLEEISCTEDIEEIGQTIEENAIIKANYVTEKYGYPCFADDTGLEVESLNNEPGVYSARYAGLDKNDHKNMDLVLSKLENEINRNALFKTVIALNINNEQVLFTGIVNGTITLEKRGNYGFGYDPIFMPNNSDKTFAEMDSEEKNNWSHRGKAVSQLIDYLSTSK